MRDLELAYRNYMRFLHTFWQLEEWFLFALCDPKYQHFWYAIPCKYHVP